MSSMVDHGELPKVLPNVINGGPWRIAKNLKYGAAIIHKLAMVMVVFQKYAMVDI